MDKPKLNKLSPEVINQIAAGEVIERPASVVKELLDNAIDANAEEIVVKVKNGGIDLIEVSDDGFGIPRANLEDIFEAHTTSKLKDIGDLNNLLSMGFRGEALSTITSVSRVHVATKFLDESIASEISYDENGKSEIRSVAKEGGTTVRVENLFFNIPVRKKYLKTAQTEYRKIYEIFLQYILIHPEIRFVLEKDGKVVEKIEKVNDSSPKVITQERIRKVIGNEEVLKMFSDGAGIKIDGYIGHPSTHRNKSSKSYIFVNGRCIVDRGITRSIYEGFSRYLPFGEKVDFVISINLTPEIVDVNVHPRKEEVRFENPFRVYSAITEAVRHTLEKELSFKAPNQDNYSAQESQSISMLRDRFNQKSSISNSSQSPMFKSKPSVEETLLFSKEILKEEYPQSTEIEEQMVLENDSEVKNVFQIFDKYIVIEFLNRKLWIVDQHAAAERVTFEKLKKGRDSLDVQNLLVPITVTLKPDQLLFIEENKDFFNKIGIDMEVEEKSIEIHAIPSEFLNADMKEIIDSIFEVEDINTSINNIQKIKDDILATMACHSSIRSGQKLDRATMLDLYSRLSICDNPYSCPHGRPAIWKLDISEIDNNFERTY